MAKEMQDKVVAESHCFAEDTKKVVLIARGILCFVSFCSKTVYLMIMAVGCVYFGTAFF